MYFFIIDPSYCMSVRVYEVAPASMRRFHAYTHRLPETDSGNFFYPANSCIKPYPHKIVNKMYMSVKLKHCLSVPAQSSRLHHSRSASGSQVCAASDLL